MKQLHIGDYSVSWLNGGVTHMDGGAMFGVVPKPLWAKKYPYNDKNQIELRTDPILIQGHGRNIVIEGGIGNGKLSDKQKRNYGVTEEAKLVSSLTSVGLSPDDIDTVMMTHMHFDHATGLSRYEGDHLVSTFKNAVIWTSEIEWKEMREPNIRSKSTYWPENWQPIVDQVKTFEHEVDIGPGIRMIHTGGHSNGHAIIMIESQGETAVHMADIMPTHAHFNPLWVLAYDDYPMDSIRAKQKWIPYAIDQNAWFIYYHDAIYHALKWTQEGQVTDKIER
ncbi:YtnP family quorum-quenching lactonase [Tuberibacillus sp. Marseille-P3662]|uniref:YtnP family quorum-quenching lactonase n=1 Tax=Tuberibacillus sp. Marseille-P3662 TaxID=1965358 RepID=UPI000A1C8EA0|nr:MBL fold metallo-hydrolase [Tuberibacillus sp. Marseille-P3662]